MPFRYHNPADGGNMALLDNWIFKLPVYKTPEAGGRVWSAGRMVLPCREMNTLSYGRRKHGEAESLVQQAIPDHVIGQFGIVP